MNKRTFLKHLGVGTVAAGSGNWLLSACTSPAENTDSASTPNSGKIWAWARPKSEWSDEDWKKQLELARDCGVNALLLEVYNGTSTFYEGGQLPMQDNLLERIVPICKSLDMEFHAWMWTMPLNNTQMTNDHPDWYAVNGLGQPANTHPAYVDYYKFMCPCHPEVQEYVAGNVESLARISEIDGVHLDYVRLPDVILAKALQPKYDIVQDKEYPQYDYSYSEHCRNLFKAQTGIDPLKDLEDPSANKAWRQFRYDSVSNLVNGKLVPKAKAYGKTITAAVFPNWEMVRQAWHTWDLDGFLPMLYHNFYDRDIDFIKEHTAKALERLNHSKPVYSGLFVPSIAPDQLAAAIAEGQEGGSSGTALFDLTALTGEHWAKLKEVVKG
ncbi:MAG: family 10 glycosylhydrolase [Mameliella sp.]|nr:family 10 glycosylhydrolase [Phaeodactylibacter sp.]